MARNRYDVDEVLETPFDFAHLKRSFVYIKKYKGKMITALMLSVFAAISGLLGPLITQYALDNTIPQKNMGQLVLLTLAFVGTIAVSITFSTIRSRIMTVVGQDIIFDIRTDLFKHLQELPFEYYDNRPHGKILIRVVNYVNSVSDMLSNGIINVILECLNMLFIMIFMFFVNVKLSLVVLSGLPIFAVIMMMIKKRQRRQRVKEVVYSEQKRFHTGKRDRAKRVGAPQVPRPLAGGAGRAGGLCPHTRFAGQKNNLYNGKG